MGVSKSHLVKDVDGEGPVRVSASVCQSCTRLLLAMFTNNMSRLLLCSEDHRGDGQEG